MINSDVKNNGLGKGGAGLPLYHNQQPPAVKKTALRDVQNDPRTFVHKYQGSPPVVEGKPTADVIKFSGSKRLAPDCSLNPPYHPSLSNNDLNEHLADVRRRFETELGKSRIQDNWDKSSTYLQSRSSVSHKKQELPQQTQIKNSSLYHVTAVSPNHMASVMTFPKGGTSDPISLWKPGSDGFPAAESNGFKVKSEICLPVNPEVPDDRWQERFLGLQNFLKQCDESGQWNYIPKLLLLPPADLSKHAVELEKRAIQLTIEEGKEMQRMKGLNILGKSGPRNNPYKTALHPHHNI